MFLLFFLTAQVTILQEHLQKLMQQVRDQQPQQPILRQELPVKAIPKIASTKFFKVFRNVPTAVGFFILGLILTAILTGYSGLISFEWSLDGGHLTIDGRSSNKDS